MSHNFQVTRVNFFCFSSGKRYKIWDATCSFCQVLNLFWYILMLAKRLALKMYVPVHKLSNYLIKQRFFCIIICQNILTLLTLIFYSSTVLWNLLGWWSFWCFLISDKKWNLSGSMSTKKCVSWVSKWVPISSFSWSSFSDLFSEPTVFVLFNIQTASNEPCFLAVSWL